MQTLQVGHAWWRTECVQAHVMCPADPGQSGDEPAAGVLRHVRPEAPGPGRPGPHFQRQ